METDFDKVDSKIICLLQEDGRMPFREIAEKIKISETNARVRVKNLLDKGVIKIVAVSDPADLGYDFDGNIKFKIQNNRLDQILEELKRIEEITFIALMTGGSDIDIDFIARSKKDFDNLIFNKIKKIEGIHDLEVSLIIRYEKDDYTWRTALEID
jgi:Lrp/AsnC family transcriptional regulator for asnA, asnC and gidA